MCIDIIVMDSHIVEGFRAKLCLACVCACFGAWRGLVPVPLPALAHADHRVSLGTAAGVCREAHAILYQEKKWRYDTVH